MSNCCDTPSALNQRPMSKPFPNNHQVKKKKKNDKLSAMPPTFLLLLLLLISLLLLFLMSLASHHSHLWCPPTHLCVCVHMLPVGYCPCWWCWYYSCSQHQTVTQPQPASFHLCVAPSLTSPGTPQQFAVIWNLNTHTHPHTLHPVHQCVF